MGFLDSIFRKLGLSKPPAAKVSISNSFKFFTTNKPDRMRGPGQLGQDNSTEHAENGEDADGCK